MGEKGCQGPDDAIITPIEDAVTPAPQAPSVVGVITHDLLDIL